MKYEKKIGILIFCFFLFLLILGATLGKILTDQYPYPELKIFNQAFSLILSKFVDPIDNDLLLLGAEKGLLYSLDPVNIFVPKGKEDKFKEWLKKPNYDCGIRLKRSGRFVYVSKVYPLSAAEGQIQIGDIVEEVNGLKYPMYDVWELELEMRGEVGKSIKIHFTPQESDTSKEIFLQIKPYPVKDFEILQEGELAKVKILEMEVNSFKNLKNELKKIPKDNILVFDLRATSSLNYDVAFKMADLFIKGPFTITYQKAKETTKVKINDEEFFSFKEIYVLQDEETFGAAEVLSYLLEQKAKATIVGTTSFGYFGIPKIYNLSDKSTIYLTTEIVTFEEGKNFMKKGIKPTVEVKKAYLYQETYNKIEETLKEILREREKKAA
ncbi:MAG: S41 family peptidase [Thermoanaerobaculia bacterium]